MLTIQDIPDARERCDKIRSIWSSFRECKIASEILKTYFLSVYDTDGTLSFESKRPRNPDYYLCNLVMQGGGVLGLAHVGFVYGLECVGARIAGVAGTSAGSIVATGIACARRGDIRQEVAKKIFDIVATMPMNQFMDGPYMIRLLLKRYLKRRPLLQVGLWPAFMLAVARLLRLRGLNPGLEFESWLANTFAELGVPSSHVLEQDLAMLKADLDELFDGKLVNEGMSGGLLRVIATAMPAGLKFTFPEELNNLMESYRYESPAAFVRASMAIPGFFEPKYMDARNDTWRNRIDEQLADLASEGQLEGIRDVNPIGFVDGGLLSNIPIDAFDHINVELPTIVVTLINGSAGIRNYDYRPNTKGLAEDLFLLANAVRLQRDRDARLRSGSGNRPRTHLVAVDTKDHNWLNFNMNDDEMVELFMCGLDRFRKLLEQIESEAKNHGKTQQDK